MCTIFIQKTVKTNSKPSFVRNQVYGNSFLALIVNTHLQLIMNHNLWVINPYFWEFSFLLKAKSGSWCNGHDCKINILIYEFWDESGFERTIRVFRLDRRISTLELFLIATTLFTWLEQVAQLSISDVKKLDIGVLNCSTSSSCFKSYYFNEWEPYVVGVNSEMLGLILRCWWQNLNVVPNTFVSDINLKQG